MRVIVVGGGTGGATFAGTLAGSGRHDVVLVEAGADFGPFAGHNWPFELLDSRHIPDTCDWGLFNEDVAGGRTYALPRAKVMGGCSSHNGCSSVRGTRWDFDRWASEVDAFWRADSLIEDFAAVEAALNVHGYGPDDTTPFQQAFFQAALQAGLPASRDMNDLDEGPGASLCPVNKRGGIRWNAAFAFVDPVRGRDNFSIVDHLEVDAVVFDGDRACGISGRRLGKPVEIAGDVVVLAAGAYGTPELLMRSGVGAGARLAAAGIRPRHELPGVGENLQDHPSAVLLYRATERLIDAMVAYEKQRMAFDEAVIVKLQSPFADGPLDIHVFANGGRRPQPAGWGWEIWCGLLSPRSRGRILPSAGEGGPTFRIQHNHFTDPEGNDLRAVLWSIDRARAFMATDAMKPYFERETEPGADRTGEALGDWARAHHTNYFHPAGTCAMGRGAAAVTDGLGRVHGLKGLMVADAALMPWITSGNTNIPVAAMAHRLARHFDLIQQHPRG
ncbi:MAG TPA: GMC family oxidoreductase [Dongiaceae bacterium]|nr:GMC family oxidoreductase [Dongiaceae bacterium]